MADVGCALGQESRALLLDGVSPSALLASDVVSDLWEAGKRVFDDETHSVASVQTAFGDWAAADDAEGDVAAPFACAFDAVLSMLVLHVLSREQQRNMLRRLARVAKPGCLLLGLCVGSELAPGEWKMMSDGKQMRWLLTADSLASELREAGWKNVSAAATSRSMLARMQSRGAQTDNYALSPKMGEMQIIVFSAERE